MANDLAQDLGATPILLLGGRIAETVTARAVSPERLGFSFLVDGQEIALPARVVQKPSGYYAVILSSLSGLPAPAPSAAVVLRIEVTTQDGRDVTAERALTGADLASGTWPLPDAGPDASLPTLVNAPFSLDLTIDPAPVMLHGQVLIDNDPAQPAAAAIITLGALSDVADARGAFRIGPLPVAATSTLRITFNGQDTDISLRPDFGAAINFRTFSI